MDVAYWAVRAINAKRVERGEIVRKCRSCDYKWSGGDAYCPECGKSECDWIDEGEPSQ